MFTNTLVKWFFVVFCLLCFFVYSEDVYVKGYYRDGTYIEGYHRSAPDSTVTNNFSYKGNINPYTGEDGHSSYRDNISGRHYDDSAAFSDASQVHAISPMTSTPSYQYVATHAAPST
jgi:hypothetical protein